jgi:hypothetical protein
MRKQMGGMRDFFIPLCNLCVFVPLCEKGSNDVLMLIQNSIECRASGTVMGNDKGVHINSNTHILLDPFREINTKNKWSQKIPCMHFNRSLVI